MHKAAATMTKATALPHSTDANISSVMPFPWCPTPQASRCTLVTDSCRAIGPCHRETQGAQSSRAGAMSAVPHLSTSVQYRRPLTSIPSLTARSTCRATGASTLQPISVTTGSSSPCWGICGAMCRLGCPAVLPVASKVRIGSISAGQASLPDSTGFLTGHAELVSSLKGGPIDQVTELSSSLKGPL